MTRHGTDLRMYNQHVMQRDSMGVKIDNKAPRLPVSVYLKESNFFADIVRLRSVEQENRNLLKQINIIYRTKGKTDCQPQKYIRHRTNYPQEQAALEKIRKLNDEFLKKLDPKLLKSRYNQEDMLKSWKKMLKVLKSTAKYPEFYDKKRSHRDSWSVYPNKELKFYLKRPVSITKDPTTHQMCFMDLKIGDLPKTFRVEIEVYSDIVPGTATNFISLCRGYSGLTYKGSVFHRIVPELFCIGGDIVNYSGTGGISIYGASFPDENFLLQHNGPGVLAMYKTEPDKNSSQFIVTFKKLSTLNGKYVVFGRIKSNLKILKLIESCGTKSGKPLYVVKVEDCGVYE